MSLHPPVILFALLRTVTRHVLRGGPIRCTAFCGSIWCGLPSCNPCVIQYLVPVVWILKVILTIRLARAFVRARRMRTAVRASNKDVRKNVLPAGSEQQTQWRLGPLLCRWSRLRAYNASRMWRAHGQTAATRRGTTRLNIILKSLQDVMNTSYEQEMLDSNLNFWKIWLRLRDQLNLRFSFWGESRTPVFYSHLQLPVETLHMDLEVKALRMTSMLVFWFFRATALALPSIFHTSCNYTQLCSRLSTRHASCFSSLLWNYSSNYLEQRYIGRSYRKGCVY